ncbi:glycoprotein-N-acetylgalactosamine 3-beta-galactosyltransferase 1-like [Diadema antillarum]|uniref:glycoprotein-N-acetylgalactosamine 3-beta-galactosyltransferase 1-like n=1 Tax=Diadema antillarum TaxID=105358 RepID=UPI003A86BA60
MASSPAKPRAFIWNFCFGLFFGGCITYVLVKFSSVDSYIPSINLQKERFSSSDGFQFQQGEHIVVDDTNRVLESERKQFEQHHEHNFLGQDAISKILYNKVRVLCWVMTGPANIEKKAVHIHATWGKRCNKIIFISSESSDLVPVVKVNTQEGRNYLWQKTRSAFQYIYDHILDEYDWFLKADDDTFVIVENLRYFLSAYSIDTPVYFGHKFKPYVKQGYMSGGGGYVASRAAVKKLVEVAFKDPRKCKSIDYVGGAEDVEIGKCFENAQVPAGDSRDALERNRFHPFQPEAHLNPDGLPKKFWYWQYLFYPPHEGYEGCCSDYSVTFHYVPPAALYNLEYLVYHLQPFGIGTFPCPTDLPQDILREAQQQQAQQLQLEVHRGHAEGTLHHELQQERQQEGDGGQAKEGGGNGDGDTREGRNAADTSNRIRRSVDVMPEEESR